jgi:hypothetical protein
LSPPFPELEDALDDAAPLDHDLFPVVWPRVGDPPEEAVWTAPGTR